MQHCRIFQISRKNIFSAQLLTISSEGRKEPVVNSLYGQAATKDKLKEKVLAVYKGT